MSAETQAEKRVNPNSGERLLLVFSPEEGKFQPKLISDKSKDPLSHFVTSLVEELPTEIKILKVKKDALAHVKEIKEHGLRRSAREVRDIKSTSISRIEGEIGRQEALLKALNGRSVVPVVVDVKGENIVGIQVHSFKDSRESTFWRRIAGNVNDINAMQKEHPQVWEIIGKATTLGRLVRDGQMDRSIYNEYLNGLRLEDLKEDNPLLRIIQEITAAYISSRNNPASNGYS